MVVTGSVRTIVAATETKTVGNISASGPLSYDKNQAYTNGTGSGQIDLLYQKTATLAATSEELDLAGVLAGVFGDTLTAVKITTVYIEVLTTTTGITLTIGDSASPFSSWLGSATDKVKLGPSGRLLVDSPVDGYTVTAGTNDKLKIDAGAFTIQYRICLLGRSA